MPVMYVPFHMHTMLSNGTTNIDSITDFNEYIKAAKDCNMPALGISEHGSLFHWVKKKEAIEAAGLKYIHCIEAYVTEDTDETCKTYEAKGIMPDGHFKFNKYEISDDGKYLAYVKRSDYPILQSEKTTSEYVYVWIDEKTLKTSYVKQRDNYHCILIAKNYDGVKEINKLVSKSYNRNDFHFYYMPRISLDELCNTSENVIITTACLGGVLHNGTGSAKDRLLAFITKNKHRCYLEIQHHNVAEQIEYNKYLYEVSKSTGVPLIVGTDTHALNDFHMEGRMILQKSKGVSFANEELWDLTFKSPDELLDAYKKQNSLPIEIVVKAMNETLVMAESIEEFKLDYSAKYPKLYSDSESVFKKKINEGIIRRGLTKLPNYREYVDRVHYEYDTYKHNNAIDFMLLEEDYKSEMRRRGVRFGYSRGSVSGSIIAYLLGITEIDSIRFNLNFERFMNTERVSLADVDTDWYSEDRKIVKDYLYQKKGLYCCDIVTFNTIALKGAIKDVIRGLHKINIEKLDIPEDLKRRIREFEKASKEQNGSGYTTEMPAELKKEFRAYYIKGAVFKEVPYDYIEFSNEVISLAETNEEAAREKYPRIFKYVDLVNGVVVSVGNHPAGCVVSPFPVDEWFGTFTTSTNEYPISLLNMKEIDSLNFVKLDILGLDNIGLIYKTCDLAGIPFATPDNIPEDDEAVWQSIKNDTTMIFQWESQSATAYLRHLFSDETIAKIRKENPNASYMDLLSIGNGAIRPAGESYRDKLANGEYATYGNKALDDFLKSTLGWLVYQEQIIEFLHSFCGYTMGEADIVRRGFAKKTGTEKFIPKIKEGFGETMLEKYNVSKEESDKIIVNFIQVIEDASSYLFSKNHADPYSWIGYICGYLRYYYPLEFITCALNIFKDNENKSLAIIGYAKSVGIRISPIKFRHSIADYNLNRETNEIYKGIASIKFMNSQIANEIYELRNNRYDSFIDLLDDLKKYTSINSRQLKILIELDFFDEFGECNYLLRLYDLFDKFSNKKQVKKEILQRNNIDFDIVRQFSGRESEKMFTEINMRLMLSSIAKSLTCRKRSLGEKIQAQVRNLGYIDIVGDEYSGMACVLYVDKKYAPRLKMYSLKKGTTLECKISKRDFNKNMLTEGNIVRVLRTEYRPKLKRNQDGGFEEIPGTRELWITSYRVVEKI